MGKRSKKNVIKEDTIELSANVYEMPKQKRKNSDEVLESTNKIGSKINKIHNTLYDTIDEKVNRDTHLKNKKLKKCSKKNKTIPEELSQDKLHDAIDEKVANNLDKHQKDKNLKSSKKNKTFISEELSQHKEVKNNGSVSVGLTHIIKKKNKKEVQTGNNDKFKKIISRDDQPQEDSPHTTTKNPGEKKKNKQSLNEEDAAVQDEDIDQFCDELSEHDNEQYESWVKLIEAKLHSHNT